MRIVKVGVLAPTNKGIPLGVQGENRATQVEFDTRPWFREYPSGTVSAVARRDGDPAPYPLTLDVEDGTAVWQVSDTDTAKSGEGAVELTMTSGGARVRSLTFKTLVTASLTDSPVDDDAWYGWLDKAVVKVDETVQSAQGKMDEVDLEWNALKADVTEKVDECGEVAAQAASDAHHAKVDAQATAKALESAGGSVAKAEAAANRAVDAALASDDSAVEASKSALSALESAEAASGSATNAATSASEAATSASNAADAASAASGSASAAEKSATDASNAKAAAQTAKAEAVTSASNAATSASNAAKSATAAAKSAGDAAASVGAINVIAPKTVDAAATAEGYKALSVGDTATAVGQGSVAIGYKASSAGLESIAIGDTANASEPFAVALGELSAASAGGSIAVGYNSKANAVNEFSVGSDELTREITHVSAPTGPNSASTKKYTDDNDAKTLSEAKKYTDDNTSNALVGNVSGKLLHVEDAWPGKPLGLTIDGACRQDGTPSPDNPVPIEVVENPVLKVTGRNLLDYTKFCGDYYVDAGTRLDSVIAVYQLNESSHGFYAERDMTSWNEPHLFSTEPLPAGQYVLSVAMWSDTGAGAYTIYIANSDYVVTSRVEGFQASNGEWTSARKKTISQAISVSDGERICLYVNVNGELSAVTKHFVIEQPMVTVVGDTSYVTYTSQTLPITLPAEHPYLAALPDGTHDEIVIDKDGNVSLVARIGVDNNVRYVRDFSLGKYYELVTKLKPFGSASLKFSSAVLCSAIESLAVTKKQGAYRTWTGVYVGYNTQQTKDEIQEAIDAVAPLTVYAEIPEKVYQLGKLDLPSLPETISNVWTDEELTTNMSMTYKRDINVAFDNLVQAVVAAAAGE